jgi:hypothetical protein
MKYLDFFTDNGRINSVKVRESWLTKHMPEFMNKLNEFITNNNIYTNRTVEKLWYYFNNIKHTNVCKNINCNNHTKFKTLEKGFTLYCSSKCSNSSDEVKKNKVNTCIEKYGVSNPYQSIDIIKKIKETNINRYGVDNSMKSDVIKNKMIKNSIEKHGVDWSLSKGGKANINKEKNLKLKFKEKYCDLELISYSKEKFGICEFKNHECNHIFTINKWQAHQRKNQNIKLCTICNPIGSYNETRWQSEIAEILRELNIEFKEKDRTVLSGKELDFYLKDLNIAIELDGLHWHSIDFKDQLYHLDKTERCEALGIHLIHIFEDEWLYKKEIVKSRILNILGKTQYRIFARKCKIKEITGLEASEFINENHIQGNIPASKRIGLFYNDDLVSVMTFGALRRALGSTPIDGTYEMYRFCNKQNMNIIGAAGKLLNYFILTEKPVEIISYADRRWSIGKLYSTLGFTFIKKTVPNLWYINNGRREHRFNYTRKKLIQYTGKTLKTDELIELLKLGRIFDSGNLKYKLTICKSPDK